MATITSTEFDTKSGSGTISLTHNDLTNADSSTFRLSGVGVISSEFDLEDSNDDAKNVFFNLGELTFTVFDRLSGGGSLFDRIDTDLLSTDEITVEINFTIDASSSTSGSSRSISDKFIAKKEDIKYMYSRRELEFSCQDKFESTDTVLDIISDNPGDVETYFDGTENPDCISAYDYVGHVLTLINSDSTNIVRSSAFPDDQKGVDDEAWVVVDEVGISDDSLATDMLYKMGAMDGAMIGSILGYNFFIHRLDDNAATITPSDVKSLEMGFGLNSYFSIKTVFKGNTENIADTSWSSTASLLGDSDGLNDDSTKILTVYFNFSLDGGDLVAADWDPGNSRYARVGNTLTRTLLNAVVVGDFYEGDRVIQTDDGSGGANSVELSDGDLIIFNNNDDRTYEVSSQTTTEIILKEPIREDIDNNSVIRQWAALGSRDNVASNAANAYAAAYNANGTRTISIEIFGIDTVKPYEAFTLNASFDDAVAGKTFRPSMIEYDLVNDLIKIEAYQIA